jgi:hypothetical protein
MNVAIEPIGRRGSPKEMSEMKPRSDPRLLRLTMDGSFDGTLGSDPVHQDRPRHGLD